MRLFYFCDHGLLVRRPTWPLACPGSPEVIDGTVPQGSSELP
ncbi:hypothetical protein HanHA300_Chr12g0451011 [Helianthus annuus]|nr:hypothetical protein HanHA300_Chr12g0451011 [Helianthus annuus]KAJ0505966.1 hypothetical protein HanHA89_Chr12g0476541 [Helianthus annuus]KAJ0675635.1 hypothetical protein HanLR1_Chr12g0453421 [Helianthus annuus]KAJ0678913.1 hypothetical protein HanOQP8_Chr12g0453321 [Helianthus annuus]